MLFDMDTLDFEWMMAQEDDAECSENPVKNTTQSFASLETPRVDVDEMYRWKPPIEPLISRSIPEPRHYSKPVETPERPPIVVASKESTRAVIKPQQKIEPRPNVLRKPITWDSTDLDKTTHPVRLLHWKSAVKPAIIKPRQKVMNPLKMDCGQKQVAAPRKVMTEPPLKMDCQKQVAAPQKVMKEPIKPCLAKILAPRKVMKEPIKPPPKMDCLTKILAPRKVMKEPIKPPPKMDCQKQAPLKVLKEPIKPPLKKDCLAKELAPQKVMKKLVKPPLKTDCLAKKTAPMKGINKLPPLKKVCPTKKITPLKRTKEPVKSPLKMVHQKKIEKSVPVYKDLAVRCNKSLVAPRKTISKTPAVKTLNNVFKKTFAKSPKEKSGYKIPNLKDIFRPLNDVLILHPDPEDYEYIFKRRK